MWMKRHYSWTCCTGENVEWQKSQMLLARCKLLQLLWENNFTLFSKDEDSSIPWAAIPLLIIHPKETCPHEPADLGEGPKSAFFYSSTSDAGFSLCCKGPELEAYSSNSNLCLELSPAAPPSPPTAHKSCSFSHREEPWVGVLGKSTWLCDCPRGADPWTKRASWRIWGSSLSFPPLPFLSPPVAWVRFSLCGPHANPTSSWSQ